MNKQPFEDVIAQEGRLICLCPDNDMVPTVLSQDTLVIERVSRPLKRDDVVLYKRKNGQYALHRVIEVKHGKYTVKGDNCSKRKRSITDRQIIGVLTAFVRDGKTFSAEKPMEHQRNAAMDMIYLLRCAVNESPPDPEKCAKMDLAEIYRQSRLHALTAAVSCALEQVTELPRLYDQAKKKAIRKLSLFEIERAALLRAFEARGIRYLPLKGILLKDDYPLTVMREMSDNDILVDPARAADVRDIMERMGYTCEMYDCGNHDVYSKPPTLEFEIHRSLFGEDAAPLFCHYYENIMDRVMQQGCACCMTDEDFYLYLLCHTYKHYIFAGTGLRSLLDVYVFLRAHADLDRGYLAGELEQLQLTEFEQTVRELAEKVFTGAPLTASDHKALDYYIRSGCYGTFQLAESNRIARGLAADDSRRSKLRYLKDRVFISGADLQMCYPFVAKHKALYPLLLIYRPIRGAILRPKEIIDEIKGVRRYKWEDDA